MNPSLHDNEYSQPTVLDTDQQQVAEVYAKALLGATEQVGASEQVMEEFGSFVAAVYSSSRDVRTFLQGVPRDDLVALIDRLLGGKAHQLLLNFLKVVADHGRMNALEAIHLAAVQLLDKLRNRVRVQVTTATPLADSQAETLKNALRQQTGAEPILVTRVNPDMIGGLIVQVGDTVYDGSVTAQLEQMRGRLIERSIHEIERRRDLVRTAG